VFSEVTARHLGATKLEAIFPGFAVKQGWLGLV